MPELPEVETIKIGLQKRISNLTIQKIQIISPKSFIGDPDLAQGQKVLNIWRRAKILGMDLTGGITLLFHLKMSGQLVLKTKDPKQSFIGGHPTKDMIDHMPNSHTRVILSFPSDLHLYFNDQRRFGWVKVIDQKITDQLFAKLGPEPLDKTFNWEVLKKNLLGHPNQPIKVAIMDQSVVSGIGNIYASEACFNAKVHPCKKVNQLSDQDFKNLYQGIVKALSDGISHGGSSRAHFVDPDGKKGYFLDYAKVYWKEDRPCPNCGTAIMKIQLRGRGTYFCPKCQL